MLPGHGEPVEDHRALIEERFVMHERRADKLHGLVTERPARRTSWRRSCGATSR